MITAFLVGVAVGAVAHIISEHALIARDRARHRRMFRHAYVVGRLKGGPAFGADLCDGIILPRDTLYVHLAKLEDEGAIEGFEEPNPPTGWPPRRMYRLPRSAP